MPRPDAGDIARHRRLLQERAAEAVARSRASRADADQRLAALLPGHQLLLTRAREQFRLGADVLLRPAPLQALVAHRRNGHEERLRALLQQPEAFLLEEALGRGDAAPNGEGPLS